jgi:hypothetical protein
MFPAYWMLSLTRSYAPSLKVERLDLGTRIAHAKDRFALCIRSVACDDEKEQKGYPFGYSEVVDVLWAGR